MNSNTKITLKSSNSTNFSDEELHLICEYADVIACQCPAYLVTILRSVKKFRHYTINCIEKFPDEAEIHSWLSEEVLQIESRLAQTVFEFMQREQLLDEENQLDLEAMRQRNRSALLEQLEPPL